MARKKNRPPSKTQPAKQQSTGHSNQTTLTLSEVMQQAIAAYNGRDWARAEQWCGLLLNARPDYFYALNLLGIIKAQTSRLQEAAGLFERSVAAEPDNAQAHSNLGNTLLKLKRFDDAVASYDRAISIKPDFAEAYSNRGNALKELKRFDDAVASYDIAISIRPDYAEAYSNRGLALQGLERFEDALASYDRAINIKPGYAEAYSNRGLALKDLKRFDDAVASFDQAISIKPDFAEAHYNRSNALKDLKRFGEALAGYDRAISIKPGYAEAYSNRGLVLQDLKRFDEASASYDRATSIEPDFAQAYVNKAFLLLLAGDFDKAWDLYEWRWKTENWPKKSGFAKDWEGTKVAGSLLVLPDQGLGDEIFHCGMLNDLLTHAESITVAVDARLVKLCQRSFGSVTVVSIDTFLNASHHFDAQVYMSGMGRYLRRNIGTLKNISACYLRACPDQVQKLRAQTANGERLICGVSWASTNADIGADKTLGLNNLRPILDLPHVDFVDLQYGDTRAEQAKLRAETGITLKHVEEIDVFNDIDGLAALISACDIVVTVSNTTAHLAAALGKPVFVMLPFSLGLLWYWHDGRDDSPWYPSVKLYRQGRMGDWSGVLERVKRDLEMFRVTQR